MNTKTYWALIVAIMLIYVLTYAEAPTPDPTGEDSFTLGWTSKQKGYDLAAFTKGYKAEAEIESGE